MTSDPLGAETPQRPQKSRRRRWPWLVVLALVVAGGYYFWRTEIGRAHV